MEFLFDNPILIMILIGLLSTLFGKKGEGQEQQPKRPPGPQQRRPSQQQPAGRREPAQQRPQNQGQPAQQRPENRGRQPHPAASTRERRPERAAASIPQLTDVQKVYEERRREVMEPARYELRSESQRTANQGGKPDVPVSLDLKPDAERLIEGIAWAQVLGPPRAREPHRTMRRR
jgi:hypothetical protein